MKTYLRILSQAKPFRRTIPWYFLFALLAVILNIVNFGMIGPLVKILFDPTSASLKEAPQLPGFSFSIGYFEQLISYGKYQLLASSNPLGVLCIVLVTGVFFANLFTYLSNRIIGNLRAIIVTKLRGKVFEKINSLHIGYFGEQQKGDLMSRLTLDIQEVEKSAVDSLTSFYKSPVNLIVLFIILFNISTALTLYTIAIIPLSGLLIGNLSKRLKKKATQSQDVLGKILGTIDESVSGIRVIKAFNAEKFKIQRFNRINQRYAKIIRSMAYKRTLASPMSQFLGVGVFTIILYIGGNIVLEKQNSFISPENFFVYIVLFGQVIEPIKSIANGVSSVQRGIVAGDRIFEILDTESSIKDAPNAITLDKFESEIEFKNVQFSYPDSEMVLKGINLQIPKGKTYALVGPSGGGKSTLMDLVPRFYDPTQGEVIIDGKNIKEYTTYSLRNHMGMVTQDAILFNDTIFNNIAFGIEASKDDVIAAAKIANAHEFILHTEHGYDTIVGDGGMKLSGGQRQRLTIARAVLANPDILLLDEATSALDSESEKLVQEALNNLTQNRTSLVIAHRLSTIQHADQICVIKEGEIVEQGTHEELLQMNGVYANLNQIQAT